MSDPEDQSPERFPCCNNCQARVWPGDVFCANCGQKRKEVSFTNPPDAAALPGSEQSFSDMRFRRLEEDPVDEYPNCPSCEEGLWPGDRYCGSCGQRNYNGIPTLGQMLGEFFRTVFDIDNRIFRTLRDLFIPGRLTGNFMKGRHQPYFTPLRLFFVMGFVMVAAYAFFITYKLGDDLDRSQQENREAAFGLVYNHRLETALDTVTKLYPQPEVAAATNSLRKMLATDMGDSTTAGYLSYKGGLTFETVEITIAQEDYRLSSPQELVDDYGVEGMLDRYLLMQVIRLNRVDKRGLAALIGQLIWGLVLLVPISALILKLLYVRRKRYYLEHLVLSLHFHAFLFLYLTLDVFEGYFFETSYLWWLLVPVASIYFLLALRRVYLQGWGKTLAKGFIFFWAYTFSLVIAISFATVVAALLY